MTQRDAFSRQLIIGSVYDCSLNAAYRLQKAISLLNDGKYLVSEVAALTGFHDYKHFNEVFKKHLHMSPSEYISYPEMVVFKTDE